MDSNAKGKSLESAVKFIQEAILETDPALRGLRCTIDTNQTVVVDRVPHEIDVVVRTNKGSDYESTYIFECKNWKEPVGKNEVIVLAEKVEVTGASKGFLVARSITEGAAAQIAKNPRLKFVPCTNDFWSPLNSSELIHFMHDLLAPTAYITFRQPIPGTGGLRLDHERVVCKAMGDQIDFVGFVNWMVEVVARDAAKEHQAQYLHAGTHWTEAVGRILFRSGDLTLDGMDVESIVVPAEGFMTTQRKRIVSKFQIEGQGQVFEFEPIVSDDFKRQLDIHLVTCFPQR